jgi:hypothetical protein
MIPLTFPVVVSNHQQAMADQPRLVVQKNQQAIAFLQHNMEAAAMMTFKEILQTLLSKTSNTSHGHSKPAIINNIESNISAPPVPSNFAALSPCLTSDDNALAAFALFNDTIARIPLSSSCHHQQYVAQGVDHTFDLYNYAFQINDGCHYISEDGELMSALTMYHIGLTYHRRGARLSCPMLLSRALELYQMSGSVLDSIMQGTTMVNSDVSSDAASFGMCRLAFMYLVQLAVANNSGHIHATFGLDHAAHQCRHSVRILLDTAVVQTTQVVPHASDFVATFLLEFEIALLKGNASHYTAANTHLVCESSCAPAA